jgi:type IV secretory pathway VirB4 component
MQKQTDSTPFYDASLTGLHTMPTGETGSGKTTCQQDVLRQLAQQEKPDE